MNTNWQELFPDARPDYDFSTRKAFMREQDLPEISDTVPERTKTERDPTSDIKLTWGNRRLERFISRYVYTYRQKPSAYRTELLSQFEQVAAENGVKLPAPSEMPANKPKKRIIFDAVQNNREDEIKTYKAYYDGENVVAYLPGENKCAHRDVRPRTMWDEVFDSEYKLLSSMPEYDPHGKNPEERAELRNRMETEMIRRLRDLYLYDDGAEQEACVMFVERKLYNVFMAYNERKKRFHRKKDQVKWTCWWTITYDDALFKSEAEFRKKLLTCFRNLAFRKYWRIMGVFEHGEENERLHFHGFFYIPEGQGLGELVNVSRPGNKRGWQNYKENTYFRNNFGINKYEVIDIGTNQGLTDYANYTTKMLHYMDKGEKVFYSRHISSEFLLELKTSELVVAFSVTNKRPIKKYVVWSGAIIKTDLALERKIALPPQVPEPTSVLA